MDDREPMAVPQVRILYGAAQIAEHLKKLGMQATRRMVFHWLERGHLRGATKLGGAWVITEQNLLANFEPAANSDQSAQGKTQ